MKLFIYLSCMSYLPNNGISIKNLHSSMFRFNINDSIRQCKFNFAIVLLYFLYYWTFADLGNLKILHSSKLEVVQAIEIIGID